MIELYRDVIDQVNKSLQYMLLGRPCEPLPLPELTDEDEGLIRMVENVNLLASNIAEFNDFARQLAKGNLSTIPPGRRNYLSGPLKELHAQLSSYVWSVSQLLEGRVVERMDFTGELSDALNSLIQRMVENSTFSVTDDTSSISSWQYHQVVTALNNLPFGIVESDEMGKVVFLNQEARELLGDLPTIDPAHAEPKIQPIVTCLNDNVHPTGTLPVVQMFMNNHTNRWYRITTDQALFPDGRKLHLHAIEDISEWKASEQELHISATTDSLTGVYNRSYGIGQLEDILQLHTEEKSHCVAFIDIDGLKTINDTYGHHEGDYTISTIANVLASNVRTSDFISRFGGDEFLVVFRGCKSNKAEEAIARMHEKIAEINSMELKPYMLSFSHGLVQINNNTDITAQEIVMLADQKMYELKTNKKANRTQ